MLAMAAIPTTPSHLGGDWRKDTSVLLQSCDWTKCLLGRDRAEAALATSCSQGRVMVRECVACLLVSGAVLTLPT